MDGDRLSGFEPDNDIAIEFTGLRPGEKLYEELITEGEGIIPTPHDNILMLKGMECNLDVLNNNIIELEKIARSQDSGRIILKLHEVVPEYTPPTSK